MVTDCNAALRITLTKRGLIPWIRRWWLITQEFNFSIEYNAGSKMSHVDAPRRNPPHVTHDEPVEVDFLNVNVSQADWDLQLN